MERQDARTALRENRALIPSTGTAGELISALDQPLEYFSQYPRILQVSKLTLALSLCVCVCVRV
jgi:hypothetical protein